MVTAEAKKLPWFLQIAKSGEVEEKFPLYWTYGHHKLSPFDFDFHADNLSDAELKTISILEHHVLEHGPLNPVDHISKPRAKKHPMAGMDTYLHYAVLHID